MKRVKKFLWTKQVEIVMCALTALFTVLVLMVCGCTPTKRVTKTDTIYKSNTSHVDSITQVTGQKIDLVMRSVSELRETMAEWLNEQIDYEEQRYDSLGRLISSIKQTTNRTGGKESAKTDDKAVYIGLSAEQADSIFAIRLTSLKADLTVKEKTVERVDLSWWQWLLIWSGVLAWLVVIFFSLKFIIRFVWK